MEKRISVTIIIVLLTLIAIVFAGMMFFEKEVSMAIYNMGRALIFAGMSVYLLVKPHKVDFLGRLKLISTGNSSETNIKVAKTISIIISVFNVAISLALYFD